MPIKERTIVDRREEIARMAADERFTVTEVALRYGVTRPTVRLWRDRYREGGRAGLVDHSHAPRSCPHQTSEAVEQLILAERSRFPLWGLEEDSPTAERRTSGSGVARPERGGRASESTGTRCRAPTPGSGGIAAVSEPVHGERAVGVDDDRSQRPVPAAQRPVLLSIDDRR